MAQIDPEAERRRLVEFYGSQMDGELEKIASQSGKLTDPAREALRAELAKRGLSVAAPEPEPGNDVEQRKLVTIRMFRDLPEALLAKGSLESAGIEAFLADDNVVRLDWFWSNMVGGVKLQVDMAEAEAANKILDQPIPADFDAAGAGEYQQPRCPNCQSLDVSFQELNKPVAYLTAYAGVPLPIHRKAWRCHSCGVEWEDSEAQE